MGLISPGPPSPIGGGVISRLRSTSKIWSEVFLTSYTQIDTVWVWVSRAWLLLTLHTQKLTKNQYRSGQDFSLRELMFDEEFSLWILLENCLRKSRNPKTQASLWVRWVKYVPRLTWEIMVKGKSMRFYEIRVLWPPHHFSTQHNNRELGSRGYGTKVSGQELGLGVLVRLGSLLLP